jgi:hypothetical protein
MTTFLLAVCLLGAAVPAAAQTAQTAPAPAQARPSVVIPRAATPPALADYLDGTPRPDEAAITTFVQREPGDGVPASQPTEAYVSYDADHLYVIFVAHESDPSAIRASMTRREGIGNDDFVGVMLDPFLEGRRAYLFIVNPLGVQLDGVTADREDDYSFDTVWESEGRLTPFGFVVRMAIPFKSLRFPSTDVQRWGLALARDIRRNNETSFWPYITRRIARPEPQLAVATGMSGISPGRNMQVIPYGAFTGARFLDRETPAFANDTAWRGGIDGKFVVKDAFTFDVTLNPDFSQVESDEPQVTINQRFEVFFEEKRPFFIENASYFQTPINLFFSRRIADPLAGVRMTGKTNGWSVGALAIDDRAPGDQLEALDPLDPDAGARTGIGVVRVQRDLWPQSTIGAFASVRDFGASQSRVASVDTRLRLSDTWVMSAQAAVSDVTDASGASRSGPAFSLLFDRTGRNWGAFLNYEDISADFSAPLGFVPRVDVRRLFPFFRYTWFPENSVVVSIRPEVSGGLRWDHAGTLNDWEAGGQLQIEMKGQSEIEIEYRELMERFAGVDFRKHRVSASASTAWLKWLETSAGLEAGREINFFPAAGRAPFLADGTQAELSLTLKPLPQFRLDQTYLFTRLAARDDLAGASAGGVIVDNHIWRSRASYQFSRRLSLRAIVDYASVLPDTALIDLETDKTFSADVLATYLINPWTAVYVGYTDGYANIEIDPDLRDRLRPTTSAFHPTGRQVFVKMSYLLRF